MTARPSDISFRGSICGGIETIASSSEFVARPITDEKRS